MLLFFLLVLVLVLVVFGIDVAECSFASTALHFSLSHSGSRLLDPLLSLFTSFFLPDFAEYGAKAHAKYLVPTGVREHWSKPVCELLQATHFFHNTRPRCELLLVLVMIVLTLCVSVFDDCCSCLR